MEGIAAVCLVIAGIKEVLAIVYGGISVETAFRGKQRSVMPFFRKNKWCSLLDVPP